MSMTLVKSIYGDPESYKDQIITLAGWVRTVRASKSFGFIELNDGTFFKNIQIVYEDNLDNFKEISRFNVGSAIQVTGKLVLTPEAKQPFEVKAERVELVGSSTPDYPLQKKRHSLEFLREIAHLRPRSNTFSAVFRVRSLAAYAIHKFFNDRDFVYVHTPSSPEAMQKGQGDV